MALLLLRIRQSPCQPSSPHLWDVPLRTRAWGAIVLAACGIAPTTTLGQGPPGSNLSVDVRVSSVRLEGDTARVEYVLFNRSSSIEKLVSFTVDAPAPPIQLHSPGSPREWDVGSIFWDRTVASWAALATIPQGAKSPQLWFRALGLPTIVTGWYQGDALPTLGEDDPENDPEKEPVAHDALEHGSIRVETIGVEPLPSPVTDQRLTMRLHRLTDRSCTLGWISDATLCYKLRGHLSAEPWFEAQPVRLAAFLRELIAGHASGGLVSDNAYWLLKTNAEYIQAMAPRKR